MSRYEVTFRRSGDGHVLDTIEVEAPDPEEADRIAVDLLFTYLLVDVKEVIAE